VSRLTSSVQDYLITIYRLTRDGIPTTTSALALQLGFAPASVTNMLQKLAATQPPLVDYHKRQSVELSVAGEEAALRILRRHRLLETFMVEVLGYRWDEVHEEADQLEHIISARFEERLARFLNNPEFDPHGDPIPDQNLILPTTDLSSLSNLQVNQSGRVRRVLTSDAKVLRYFDEMGVRPGEEMLVTARDPFDSVVTIKIGKSQKSVTLGTRLADLIEIEVQSS
jgi:DtxR family transcriptional regulator, Mn-dependent transcriptional regulator